MQTTTQYINNKFVKVKLAHRPVVGAGGYELAGFTVPLGPPAGGYQHNHPVLASHPLNMTRLGMVRQPNLTTGMRTTGQLRGKKGSTAKPAPKPMGSKQWAIV